MRKKKVNKKEKEIKEVVKEIKEVGEVLSITADKDNPVSDGLEFAGGDKDE